MPPSMPQRLGCGCGAACGFACCGAACCCAGFAGVEAGGAVTLRCAPTKRRPPIRRASASVATSATPQIRTENLSNHLGMTTSSVPMLSKPDAAMDGDDAGGEVIDLHLAEATRFHHRLEGRLIRMHADRFGEIAVGLARADHPLAQPWQHAERVQIVERLEWPPDLRELEHHGPP